MTVESIQELDALIAARHVHQHADADERPLTRAERRKRAHEAKLAHSKAAAKFNNRKTGGRQ